MERKFKEMSEENIVLMMDEIKKKSKEEKSDPRDAGILLALEFELDIRKNEGKFVNVEQLEKIQAAVTRLYDELQQVDIITISSDKAIPSLVSLRDNLQMMEQYVNKHLSTRQKVDITDIVG